jgi:hypothetical protein
MSTIRLKKTLGLARGLPGSLAAWGGALVTVTLSGMRCASRHEVRTGSAGYAPVNVTLSGMRCADKQEVRTASAGYAPVIVTLSGVRDAKGHEVRVASEESRRA